MSDEREDGDGDAQPAPEKAKRWLATPRRRIIALAAVIVLIAGVVWGVLWWLDSRRYASTPNAYVKAPVVNLSPAVSGHVTRIHVRANQLVKAGDPLFEVAATSFETSLASAEAELATALAQLDQARAAYAAALQQVDETRATAAARSAEAAQAARDLARYRSLSAAAVAEQQVDQARGQAQTTAEQARAAREGVGTQRTRAEQARADIAAAEARVRQARSQIASARLSLADSVVEAPISGRITQFEIEPGDYVAPGRAVLALVGEARWIEANFKEEQLRLMRLGQPVEVRIDAFSDYPLRATLDSFQTGTGSEFSAIPTQNATSNWVETVQRVPVRIKFAPDAFANFPANAPVLPGMSVEARVRVR
jgi:membrane fusion protein, multidrug efflux system